MGWIDGLPMQDTAVRSHGRLCRLASARFRCPQMRTTRTNGAVEFFAELLAQSYVRGVNEGAAFACCLERYKHPEALIRMEAIWLASEHLRLEPALGEGG